MILQQVPILPGPRHRVVRLVAGVSDRGERDSESERTQFNLTYAYPFSVTYDKCAGIRQTPETTR